MGIKEKIARQLSNQTIIKGQCGMIDHALKVMDISLCVNATSQVNNQTKKKSILLFQSIGVVWMLS